MVNVFSFDVHVVKLIFPTLLGGSMTQVPVLIFGQDKQLLYVYPCVLYSYWKVSYPVLRAQTFQELKHLTLAS